MNAFNNLVFVYGTLKRGFHNNHHFSKLESRFVGEATTLHPYSMFNTKYNFPALLRGGYSHIIQGELYECSDKQMAKLDKLEGVPDLFVRKEILVECKSQGFKVWCYFLNTKDTNNLEILDGQISSPTRQLSYN